LKSNFFDFKIFAVPEPLKIKNITEGDGNEGVLVLCQPPETAPDERDFLKRILQAVQLELDRDVFLVHITPDSRVSLSAIRRQAGIKKVLSFGIGPDRLGLRFNTDLYRPLHHQDLTYLFADDIQTIHEERQRGEKRRATALWRALQEMFPNRTG
jgi:hypothetical protein